MEMCHLYNREVCDVSEKECTKCQLEHLWNQTISLVINEITSDYVGGGAFSYRVKGGINDARKKTAKVAIEKLKRIELLMENLNI